MIAKNVTIQDLERALDAVNERYSGNVTFNRLPEVKGRAIYFTLRVLSSRGPGHRLSIYHPWLKNRRRLVAACWHVHGHFFEELFRFCPNAKIIAAGKIVTINGGNWVDHNFGGATSPNYYSHACECN